MSEEKKYTNNEEICNGIEKLTEEDLESVNGGMITGATVQVKGEGIAILNTTEATSALQGKAVGVVVTTSEGQPGAEMCFCVR